MGKTFWIIFRLRTPLGAGKNCEARLAGQAAIEGLSAPMRLPSAIPHTPKLSECFTLIYKQSVLAKPIAPLSEMQKNVAQLLALPIQRECAS